MNNSVDERIGIKFAELVTLTFEVAANSKQIKSLVMENRELCDKIKNIISFLEEERKNIGDDWEVAYEEIKAIDKTVDRLNSMSDSILKNLE